MHNNYYFLRQVSKALQKELEGSVVSECFSQSKDELVIRFETQSSPFFIKANMLPSLSCLTFPETVARARRNSIDLFPAIVGRRVMGVRQYRNERSFAIVLSDDHHFLFKMHGNRANAILFFHNEPIELFKKNILADARLDPTNLDRDIDFSREFFLQNQGKIGEHYFTFGKKVWNFLERKGYEELRPDQRWTEVKKVIGMLEHPTYYITKINSKPELSLLPIGDVVKELTNPLEAANEFYRFFTQDWAVDQLRKSLVQSFNARIDSATRYIAKNQTRLDELRGGSRYKMFADLIMANLHAIPIGADHAVVSNFYENNISEKIPLKRDLSPQKNAEIYYRKAKNQHIEQRRLEESVLQKQNEIDVLTKKIGEILSIEDMRVLKKIQSEYQDEQDADQLSGALPYHEFFFEGFRIRIGKNAQGNDILTTKLSRKDDLWLHARDVSGSHVVITQQPGKVFPKHVIEYAASLAAWNSKRKNESLCPVIVTQRKFVRKRKGDPPGAVVVDREEVVMVPPLNPSE